MPVPIAAAAAARTGMTASQGTGLANSTGMGQVMPQMGKMNNMGGMTEGRGGPSKVRDFMPGYQKGGSGMDLGMGQGQGQGQQQDQGQGQDMMGQLKGGLGQPLPNMAQSLGKPLEMVNQAVGALNVKTDAPELEEVLEGAKQILKGATKLAGDLGEKALKQTLKVGQVLKMEEALSPSLGQSYANKHTQKRGMGL